MSRRSTIVNGQFLLDQFSGAAAAYSLRRLRNAYTGNCIRVRRSSDNAELDIGFTPTGVLDTAALLAHVGAGDGFVTTWYDQSGNGNNATQATALNQPRIINSGVIQLESSKPSILFGLNQETLLNVASFSGVFANLNTPLSIFGAARKTDANSSGIFLRSRNSSLPAPIYSISFLSNQRINYFTRNNLLTGVTSESTSNYNFNLSLYSSIYTGSVINFFQNAVSVGSINHSNGNTGFTVDRFSIGNEINEPSYARFPFIGAISEIVLYNSNETSNRTAIENNIMKYYGI